MDNLENVSDIELRNRLLQYGFANIPITDTTRNILVKKLRIHLNNEKIKLKNETQYALRYSSDDELDFDTKSKKCSVKKMNIKTSMLPPKNLSVLSRSSNVKQFKSSYANYIPKDKLTDSSKVLVPRLNFETNNDYVNKNYNSHPLKKSFLSTSNNYFAPNHTIYNSSKCIDQEIIQRKINDKCIETPYICDFTRRLLNLRDETLRENNLYEQKKSKIITPAKLENNVHMSRIRRFFDLRTNETKHLESPSTAFSNLLRKLHEQFLIKQTIIPYMLIGIFFFFFFLLIIVYATITPDLANALNEKNTNFIDCSVKPDFTSYNCIKIDSLNSALDLIKLIIPSLQKRMEKNRCIDSTISYTMSAKEVVRIAQQKASTIDVRKIIKDLHNAEYLIENNPQWQINHVNDKGEKIYFNDVVLMRNNQENYFVISNPHLPFLCSIYNKLQKFFFIVGSIGLIVLGGGIIYLVYKMIVNYNKSKREMTNYFVEEILSNLMKKAMKETEQRSIVLNHLRDKIIPLHKRQKMDMAWKEAVTFLENNESRVQFEMGIINGEDCKMLKWLDTVSPEIHTQMASVKKWQSPAFDKTNKIINPPTSCLKIRQMFDKFEVVNSNLKTIIQDAILEKVGPNCKIYDIQLDIQSCCVYVRCASEEDAGIVHNEINGWWFDKRLVSIKFLRIERYLNRFSKSLAGPVCLHPSNAKNLSMSQCRNESYHIINDNLDDMEN